jgi:hypothetical protein
MRIKGILPLAFLAHASLVMGQSHVYCLRIIGHTPEYERILMPRGFILRPNDLRGVDDLRAGEQYAETNRIDRIFADPSRERTNGFWKSCLPELPMEALSFGRPGGLLSTEEVRELLRDTVTVPRPSWTNHIGSDDRNWRYVFSLVDSKKEEFVIDERYGACALVFFPDGTYRCVMDPGYSCLQPQNRPPPVNGNVLSK